MKKVLSVDNMRKSDAATIASGISGRELMYRAGAGIYDVLMNNHIIGIKTDETAVLVVCGTGNNAGDGYVVADMLNAAGVSCVLFLAGNKFSDDGQYYYDICAGHGINVVNITQNTADGKSETAQSDAIKSLELSYDLYSHAVQMLEEKTGNRKRLVVLDCLLGTGFKGKPRNPIDSIIKDINSLKDKYNDRVTIVSVDINSGLNGDTGLYEECVISDITVTIGDVKPGLYLNKGKDVAGAVINVDIGIEPVDKPYYLAQKSDIAKCLPRRMNDSNKGTYGYIALVGGSSRYQGAIRLASMANAAMRSGAGVVMVATPRSISGQLIPNMLESTIFPISDCEGEAVFVPEEMDTLLGRVKVIAFGMGIGATNETTQMLRYILEHYEGVLIVDADGLNCLSRMDSAVLMNTTCKAVVLTPHIKEFSRLCGRTIDEIRNNSIDLSLEYAKDSHVVLLLKGPTTLVTDGSDVVFVDKGCPGMATAGSGDVLSGILAAVCAYADSTDIFNDASGASFVMPVVTGAYINGLAGEYAQDEYGAISMIASDTVAMIPKAIKDILKVDTAQ